VSGYPADEAQELERTLLGQRDDLMVVGEPFGLWVIAHERYAEVQRAFPLDRAGLPVVFCADETPYRIRKVRLLNGTHTAMVFMAYIMGYETVGQAMACETTRAFVKRVLYDEIAPTMIAQGCLQHTTIDTMIIRSCLQHTTIVTVPLDEEEVRAFADSVVERFDNPFIKHRLLSIALNSVSKWKARILPTLLDYKAAKGCFPPGICLGLAAMKVFYEGEMGETQDQADFSPFWAHDINAIPGLSEYITIIERKITDEGILHALTYLLSGGDPCTH